MVAVDVLAALVRIALGFAMLLFGIRQLQNEQWQVVVKTSARFERIAYGVSAVWIVLGLLLVSQWNPLAVGVVVLLWLLMVGVAIRQMLDGKHVELLPCCSTNGTMSVTPRTLRRLALLAAMVAIASFST